MNLLLCNCLLDSLEAPFNREAGGSGCLKIVFDAAERVIFFASANCRAKRCRHEMDASNVVALAIALRIVWGQIKECASFATNLGTLPNSANNLTAVPSTTQERGPSETILKEHRDDERWKNKITKTKGGRGEQCNNATLLVSLSFFTLAVTLHS